MNKKEQQNKNIHIYEYAVDVVIHAVFISSGSQLNFFYPATAEAANQSQHSEFASPTATGSAPPPVLSQWAI